MKEGEYAGIGFITVDVFLQVVTKDIIHSLFSSLMPRATQSAEQLPEIYSSRG